MSRMPIRRSSQRGEEGSASAGPSAADQQMVLFELIDGELVPYWADDPDRCAFPDDGRQAPDD